MGLSEGREAEHSGAGPPLPVTDSITETPRGASGASGASGGVGGCSGDFHRDPIKTGSLSSFHKISSFVPIACE
ncbi:hypothetical protein KUCAC02_002435 [Chaenocephalus aceratus]|uniref:Uncharacterized protein n=1 Tax=Chaenocephalus aceratus TaxID=36190 RepID=A0ACB9XUB5_CHAAC|nr:hypothetical protein KUCAC02_002435 [Chaenocephalus aceratus]